MRSVFGIALALIAAFAARAGETPEFAWVRTMSVQFGRAACDRAGNSYLCGTIPAAVTLPGMVFLGTNALNSTNGPVVLAKLDRSGDFLWVRQAGNTNAGPDTAYGTGIAIDSATNVVITGFGVVRTNLIFGSISVMISTNGSKESFVAKYDPDGNVLWARSTGGIDGYYEHDVAVDSNDNILIGALASGTNSFLMLKLDPNGNEMWRLKATSGSGFAGGITTDDAGNSYVAGFSSTSLSVDGKTITNLNGGDAFVLKLDPAGHVLWVRSALGNNLSGASGVALDAKTNVLVTGFTQTTNVFGFLLSPIPRSAPYVMKLTKDGSNQWLRSPMVAPPASGPYSGAFGRTIAVDGQDDVYIGGAFQGTMSIDGTVLGQVPSEDAFVAKFSSAGSLQWALSVGGDHGVAALGERVKGLALGFDGVLVCGAFYGSNAQFGSLTPINPTSNGFLGLMPYAAPTLTIAASNTEAQLMWPAFPAGYGLITTTNLTSAWTTNESAIATNNGSNFLVLPISAPQHFFRLRKP